MEKTNQIKSINFKGKEKAEMMETVTFTKEELKSYSLAMQGQMHTDKYSKEILTEVFKEFGLNTTFLRDKRFKNLYKFLIVDKDTNIISMDKAANNTDTSRINIERYKILKSNCSSDFNTLINMTEESIKNFNKKNIEEQGVFFLQCVCHICVNNYTDRYGFLAELKENVNITNNEILSFLLYKLITCGMNETEIDNLIEFASTISNKKF